MNADEIADRIKERARKMHECEHRRTHVENDRRFGPLVICDDCDQVVDRVTN